MHRWVIIVVGAASVVSLSSVPVAHAYRPFDGTDADVATTGDLELEVGPAQLERLQGATTYTPGSVVNYGVAAGFELVLDLDGVIGSGSSLLASDVLVKHVLRNGSLQDKAGPSLALETGVLLPDVPVRGSGFGWIATAIASQHWDSVTVHLNATGLYQRAHQLGGFASVIGEGPGDWVVRPVTELLIAHEGDRENAASALAGVIWQKHKELSFDGAVLLEREHGAFGVGVRLGFTWAVAI
ncbi:MAG TPA: hypothetical protein VH165_30705 [Kofleriaceae bacterium]|jgi:hypothetical protein|nr:hypothetical protein [Kofleriaceae bacterium]